MFWKENQPESPVKRKLRLVEGCAGKIVALDATVKAVLGPRITAGDMLGDTRGIVPCK
jgi:hypothetical protein